MNLKRLRGIAAAALTTIAAALFASCSNSMAGSVDGGSNVRMATLSLSATGIPNDYAEQFEASYPNAAKAAARSILPDDPYDIGKVGDSTSQSENLTFYLSGTSTTGKKLKDTQVKITAKAGTDPVVYEYAKADGTSISIDSMSWNLVLTAYKKYDGQDATTNEPVLQGFCSADLRNGSGTASFTLSPENLKTPGTVEIKGSFKPYGNVDSYTMGIYKKDSASGKIYEEKVTGVTGDGDTEVDFTCDSTKDTSLSLLPGSYLYKMVFKNAAGVITGSFIDTLVVDAGNALKQDIGLIDVVNKRPGAPTNFTANLVKGSEKPDGTYQVRLNWTSGGGETNFEVELTEYDADGTATDTSTKKIYGMESMDLGTTPDGVINFQGSDVWAGEGGAMTYGDETAYFKLKLGVVYEVRIRARNYVGVSEDTSTADGWTKRGAGTDDADGNVAYGSEKINRMKIEYNLNGGILSLYNNNNRLEKTENYTEYRSWDGTLTLGGDLLEIGTGTSDNQLTKGSSPFNKWVDSANATPKVFYQNLSVTADFGSSLTGSVSMKPGKDDVLLEHITLSYQSATSAATSEKASERTSNTVKKKMGATTESVTKLTVALDTDAYAYKNVKFELIYDGSRSYLGYDDAAKNSCTLSLDDYVGKIQVRVIADTANATGMSQTLLFELQ